MTMEIIDTNTDNILEYGVCGYKDIRRAGYPEKIEWPKKRFPEGMKIKVLYSDKDGTQGMIRGTTARLSQVYLNYYIPWFTIGDLACVAELDDTARFHPWWNLYFQPLTLSD